MTAAGATGTDRPAPGWAAALIGPRPWPEQADLRGWLGRLAAEGRLGTVRSRVDPDQEVAAVLEAADGRRGVLFGAVGASPIPLVGGIVHGRADLAAAAGCAVADLAAVYAAALERPRPTRTVAAGEAPVLQRRWEGEALLSLLPLLVQHEHDAGRYLTSGLVTVRDPESGATNLSINRLLAVGERELRALVLPGRLREVLAQSEAAGRDLPVAIVVGADPLLEMASQAPADRFLDDLEVAGALGPEPVAVTEAPGTDLVIPAAAEMALVGRFLAGRREPEGPFGEFPRTYGPAGPGPVITIDAAWSRHSPLFQTVLSGGREHFLVGGIPREAHILAALRSQRHDVAAVRLPEFASCRLAAVVALRHPAPGAARNAALGVLAAAPAAKCAVVVDHDVDIFHDGQLGWALATRVRPGEDLVVIPGARGSELDPSASGGVTSKLIVDATVPGGDASRHALMRTGPRDPGIVAGYLAEAGLV